MRCPACQFIAVEDDAACRQCGFSLEMADRTFGIPPVLERPVTDLAGELGGGGRAQVERAVRALERRFPQLGLAVIIASVPEGVPTATWAFWLFNRGSFFSAVEKGGDNHGVLLMINAVDGRGVLTVGYGLEPFIAEAALKDCLNEAAPALAQRRYAAAILNCLARLEHEFTEVCAILPHAFGYAEDGAWIDVSKETETADQPNSQAEDLF